MRRHSPYNYAFDNPIRFIDPDGMIATDVIEDDQFKELETGDCCGGNPVAGQGEGIARAVESKINQAGEAIAGAVAAIGEAINNGLKAADEFVTGDTPDTRGEGDRTSLGGETLVKTEGSKGSQGIVGKPSTENDITILTEAKGVGPAPGAPSGTADVVKSAASEVSNAINTVQAATNASTQPQGNTIVRERFVNDSTRETRVIQYGRGGFKTIKVDSTIDKTYQHILKSGN